MIAAGEFIAEAARRGFDFYAGVPCSFLTPLINALLGDARLDYVGAASEGEAVAIAAGAWLAGRRTVVLCQNSGLGNAVNPLTSLNAPFRIPTLLITTWRGQPGIPDEPQHKVMGEITHRLLSDINVEHAPFPRRPELLADDLGARDGAHGGDRPALRAGDGEGHAARRGARRAAGARARRRPARGHGEATAISRRAPRCSSASWRAWTPPRRSSPPRANAAASSSRWPTGRSISTRWDRWAAPRAWRSASPSTRAAPVVVLDGDGAALMKLGSWATIGAHCPGNLTHILLDNGVHDSTGGQPTVSASVDFAAVALACGYRYAVSCRSLDGFEAALQRATAAPKPAFIHARIAPGSMARLGRPTIAPEAVARRFKAFVAAAADHVR